MRNALFVSLIVVLLIKGGRLFGTNECQIWKEEKFKAANVSMLPNNPIELLNVESEFTSLSHEERRGLIDRKKALKMTVDINLKFRKQWGDAVFKQVTDVNFNHKRGIMTFMVAHNVTDPLSGCKIGEFNSENIDSLYDYFLELGMSSFENAVMVDYYLEAVAVESLRYQLDEIVTHELLYNTYEKQLEISQAQLNEIHDIIETHGFSYSLGDFLAELEIRVKELNIDLPRVNDFNVPVN